MRRCDLRIVEHSPNDCEVTLECVHEPAPGRYARFVRSDRLPNYDSARDALQDAYADLAIVLGTDALAR